MSLTPDPRRAVAILGMGLRFPGRVDTPEALWEVLSEGRDAIAEIPADRLDVAQLYDPRPATEGRIMSRFGGYLEDIGKFDAGFFHVSPREAERMDPQQRLVLETAWEALEHAGIDAARLRGRGAGVYVGQWISDFEARLLARPEQMDFEMTTGSGRYATAGRLSYFLGLEGPSLSIDTACSSGLTALHLALQGLRSEETELALVSGVNVILSPHITVGYSQSRMMAPDGRCKFGDARGDGYVRSEGAVTFVLKRLDRALAEGDPILAAIHGSTINNDGSTGGRIGRPGPAGQRALLRSALHDAGLSPGDIGYIEAHGTGTAAGDPIELGAISDVIARHRGTAEPLLVGSVKTNIGHTEGAAGLAGLAKAVLILKHRQVPPSLHCHEPNPAIDWQGGGLRIATEQAPLPAESAAVGVSSFGVGGSNAHVVLGPAPAAAAQPAGAAEGAALPCLMLPLSAASDAALRALAGSYADWIEAHSDLPLERIAAAAARQRTGLTERAVFITDPSADGSPGRPELVARLRAFASGGSADVRGSAGLAPRRVVFVAPGQGGQWIGMARVLMQQNSAFAASIAACEAALAPLVDWSLVEQLEAEPGAPGWRLDRIEVIQPVLASVTLAYAAAWRALGIAPDAVIGHSMGEASAAAISGALPLAQALEIVVRRSALMARTRGQGGMALVELPEAALAARLASFDGRLSVAAHNGPRSAVVSGEEAALETLLQALERDAVFCRRIKVDVASHSPQMAPHARVLEAELAGRIAPVAGAVPFFSTVHGARLEGTALDPGYWGRNLREPVEFHRAVTAALSDGEAIFVELGPHPVLAPSIRDCLQAVGAPPAVVASGQREAAEDHALATAFAALWAHGGPVAWEAAYPEAEPVLGLPRYPWQRSHHWVEAARLRRVGTPEATDTPLDEALRQTLFQTEWHQLEPPAAAPLDTGWLVLAERFEDADAAASGLRKAGLDAEGVTLEVLGTAEPSRGLLALAPDGDSAPDWPIRVWQALRRQNRAAPPCIAFATLGATAPLGAADERAAPWQAALMGAVRVLAEETADCTIRLIDRDPGAAHDWAGLAAELGAADAADEVALRRGARFAPRLRRLAEDLAPSDDPAWGPWRRDAACLITGGLGGIGLRIALRLAQSGARHLILLGRTALPPRESWSALAAGTAAAAQVAAVRAVEAAGASVELAAVDVADEAAMSAFLARRAAEARPPIRSVVHAAASAAFGLIENGGGEAFAQNFGAKLRGGETLDRLLPDLDVFVAFSSIAGTLGSIGEAGYAAANTGLEALAENRRRRGQSALSIAWGPWQDVGIMTHSVGAGAAADLARLGVRQTLPDAAETLFEWLVRRAVSAQVLDVDWATFARARRGRETARFADLVAPAEAIAAGPALADIDLEARRTLLLEAVRVALGAVLQLDPKAIAPGAPLGTMGLNSVMALDLRNRLEDVTGRPLPAILAWNYPTAAALALHLANLFEGAEVARAAGPDDTRTDAEDAASLDALVGDLAERSDEDIAAMLRGPAAARSER